MTRRGLALVLLVAACRAPDDATVALPPVSSSVRPGDEPPTPVNANSPVVYPPALLAERIGGTVLLRLYITAQGVVVPDSTRIDESSGYPALDSAAVLAAPQLRYSPALRSGMPVATAFRQPVLFVPPPPPAGGSIP